MNVEESIANFTNVAIKLRFKELFTSLSIEFIVISYFGQV